MNKLSLDQAQAVALSRAVLEQSQALFILSCVPVFLLCVWFGFDAISVKTVTQTFPPLG